MRQRVRLRRSLALRVVEALTLVLALALLWYGLMVVLLSVKVPPHTVNAISAYRTVYNWAAGLTPGDFTTAVSLIAGVGGLIVLLVLGGVALAALPRPYLARGEFDLGGDGRGTTVIEPRAVERVAELAARGNPGVTGAAGRLGDRELAVDIAIGRAAQAADILRDVHARVGQELTRHELPPLPVDVILAAYNPTTRRELS